MFSASFKDKQLEQIAKDFPVPREMCGDMFDGSVTEPVFKIRALTGPEFYQVREEDRTVERMKTILDGIKGNNEQLEEASKELAGQRKDPLEYLKDKKIVELGCVEPAFKDKGQLNYFAKNYPQLLVILATEIMTLSGMGGVAKKKPC